MIYIRCLLAGLRSFKSRGKATGVRSRRRQPRPLMTRGHVRFEQRDGGRLDPLFTFIEASGQHRIPPPIGQVCVVEPPGKRRAVHFADESTAFVECYQLKLGEYFDDIVIEPELHVIADQEPGKFARERPHLFREDPGRPVKVAITGSTFRP